VIPNSLITNQPSAEAGLSLSDWADIASVLVAVLAFAFSTYTFWKQRAKDRQSQQEAEELRAKMIRLQWYKDLVVVPNIHRLNEFYEDLHNISNRITTPDLSEAEKNELIEEVKEAQRKVRKTLVDSIVPINDTLYIKVLEGLDAIVDQITVAIDDDTLKLSNQSVKEKQIGEPIRISKRNLFTLIYSYRGE
jgi:hypothetical protein